MDETRSPVELPDPLGGIKRAHLEAVSRSRTMSFTLGPELDLVAVNGVNPTSVRRRTFTWALRASWALRERSSFWKDLVTPGELCPISVRLETVRFSVSLIGHVLHREESGSQYYEFSLYDVTDSLTANLRSATLLLYRQHMGHYLKLMENFDRLTSVKSFQ